MCCYIFILFSCFVEKVKKVKKSKKRSRIVNEEIEDDVPSKKRVHDRLQIVQPRKSVHERLGLPVKSVQVSVVISKLIQLTIVVHLSFFIYHIVLYQDAVIGSLSKYSKKKVNRSKAQGMQYIFQRWPCTWEKLYVKEMIQNQWFSDFLPKSVLQTILLSVFSFMTFEPIILFLELLQE